MIESNAVGTPAIWQCEVVTRRDYRQRTLERPVGLTENRFVLACEGVSKDSACFSLARGRDALHAVLVVNVVHIARDVERLIFAVTLCLRSGSNEPGAKLFHLADI